VSACNLNCQVKISETNTHCALPMERNGKLQRVEIVLVSGASDDLNNGTVGNVFYCGGMSYCTGDSSCFISYHLAVLPILASLRAVCVRRQSTNARVCVYIYTIASTHYIHAVVRIIICASRAVAAAVGLNNLITHPAAQFLMRAFLKLSLTQLAI
jgi:hypothetical protein